jgi:secreted trypsin-like serine protease
MSAVNMTFVYIFVFLFIVDQQISQHSPEARFLRLRKRIIGGSYAPPEKFPWAISLRGDVHAKRSSVICGATIISNQWLLTAAHCFYAMDRATRTIKDLRSPSLWHISAGQVFVELGYRIEPQTYSKRFDDFGDWYNYMDVDKRGASISSHYHVDKIILHPNYRPEQIEWDIALMRLNTPLPLSSIRGVSSAYLPSQEDGKFYPPVGTSCVTVGWGCTQAGGQANSKAKYASLEVISNAQCNDIYQNMAGLNAQHEFCAGFVKKNIGICPGDSGGGLICQNKNKWTIAGITSATHGKKPGEYPGLFTRVSYFNEWIHSIIS